MTLTVSAITPSWPGCVSGGGRDRAGGGRGRHSPVTANRHLAGCPASAATRPEAAWTSLARSPWRLPQAVGRHVVVQAGFPGVAGEHRADAAGGVRPLPRRLQHEHRALLPEGCDMRGERVLEGRRERHEVASRTWAHGDLTRQGEAFDRASLEGTHELLTRLAGRAPTLCRAPEGRIDSVGLAVCASLRYEVMLWSKGSPAATPAPTSARHRGGPPPPASCSPTTAARSRTPPSCSNSTAWPGR